jgi:hypothetical protein
MPIQSIWMCSNTSYTSNMDVGCSLGPLAASTMTPQRHLAPRYPTCTGVTVRLDPQAQPQHMNVLKHFIYLQYGCWMQFGTSCSLNHDTTTSFGSTLPHLNRCYSKVGPICPTTAYECAQTLHIPPIWMWDADSEGLQPPTTTSHCHWGPISPQCCKIGIGPPTLT